MKNSLPYIYIQTTRSARIKNNRYGIHAFRRFSDTLGKCVNIFGVFPGGLFFLIFSLNLFICSTIRATEYNISSFSLSDGLVNPTVKCALLDSKDYLWIGTKGGLNKVDRGKVFGYRRNPALKNSLPDNDIVEIFEDENSTIWVICSTGVVRYDRGSDSFSTVTTDDKALRARSHLLLPTGVLLGGAGQIFFYDYNTGEITVKPTKGGSDKYYTSILPWSRDRYLLSTRWDGMWVYNTKTSDIEPFNLFKGKRIMASMVDSDGDLWMSEYGAGIHLISRHGHVLPFDVPELEAPVIVMDIQEIAGDIYFATDGAGIVKFNKSTGSSERIDSGDNFPSSLRSVNCLYHDKLNNIYAGTVRGGLVYLHSTPMKTIGISPELETLTVTSIVPDKNRHWVGIDGNGIALYNPERDNLLFPIKDTEGLKIVSMENYNDKYLLVSTYDNGLYLFDKASQKLSPAPNWLRIITEDNRQKGIPIDLKKLSGDRIAVVTDRIYISDITGSKVSVIEPQTGEMSRLRIFYSDMDNLLCYSDQEVFRIDLDDESATSLFKVPGKHIECAAFDGSRYIYAGTSSGVEQYDFETSTLSPPPHRLPPGSAITAIAINDDTLWLSALGKIFTRNIPNGKIRGFGPDDGVLPNEFIYKAVAYTPQYILMGGVNGLLKINLTEVEDYDRKRSIEPLSLSEVIIDGLPVSMDGNTAHLPDNYSTLKLRLTGGHSNPFKSENMRFFIGHRNINSPIESTDNTLTLGHLQASRGGRYDIYASVIDHDGRWTEPAHVGAIVVPTVWWRKPIPIVFLSLFGALALCLAIYYFFNQRKARINKRIEEHRRQSLEKEVGFLMNLNYELRTPLTLIYSRLRMLTDNVSKGKLSEEKVLEELDNIYRNTGKMRDIINTTVELWRSGDIQTGETLEKTEISDLIKEVVNEVRPSALEKKLSIDTQGVTDNLTIICDLPRATIALLNVMRSTISHAAEKTGINIETLEHGEYIRILISFRNDDSHGAGEEFRYADHLMALMDGELTYTRNDNGKPSIIVMDFPKELKRQSQSAANLPGTNENAQELEARNKALDLMEEPAGLDLSHLTVIVVEDDPELRELLVSSLSYVFKRVLEASNGQDALTHIKNSNPDLIITEARLPKMTGLELCRIIKRTKEYSHIPVIMLTTRLEEMSIANGNNYGADNYLTKPFDINVLELRCMSVLKSFDRVRQWYRRQASDILPKDKRQTNEAEAFILKVKEIIEQNISVPGFGVEDIVDKMLVSRSTLYGRFKEVTGQSLGNYINDYKLNRAKEMLSATEMTMVEISDALGFTTQRYFSTFFKDKTGMTPTAFRNQEVDA